MNAPSGETFFIIRALMHLVASWVLGSTNDESKDWM